MIAYETMDGTATSPADYTATMGTLIFAPGDPTTQQTVEVVVKADDADEADETFTLSISVSDAGGQLVQIDAGTVTTTILDGAMAVRSPLVLTGDAIQMVDENVQEVGTWSAAPESSADVVTWALFGDDANLFELSADMTTTGVNTMLRFRNAPDYEDPMDADDGNTYDFTLRASVDAMSFTEESVMVTVMNVDESVPLRVTIGEALVSSTNPPVVGVAIVAELEDPDGLSGNVVWRWYNTRILNGDREGPVLLVETTNPSDGSTSAGFTYTLTETALPLLDIPDTKLLLEVTYMDILDMRTLEWVALHDVLPAAPPQTTVTADPIVASPLTAVGVDPRVGGVVLSWGVGLSNEAQMQIVRWEYRWREEAATGDDYSEWIPVPDSGYGEANANEYTVTNLQNGISYLFQVRGFNTTGYGEPSAPVAGTPAGVPRAPVLTATGSDARVELRWTLEDNNGSPVTSWEYEATEMLSGSSTSSSTLPTLVPDSGPGKANADGYVVRRATFVVGLDSEERALASDADYTFTVRAVNRVGAGDPSVAVMASTMNNPPRFADTDAVMDTLWQLDGALVQLVLPEAMGGDAPLSYELTGSLPMGVTLSDRVLDGMPTMVMSASSYTWRVTDADGDTAMLEFMIEVREPPPEVVLVSMQTPAVTVPEEIRDGGVNLGVMATRPELSTGALSIGYVLESVSAVSDDYMDAGTGTLTIEADRSVGMIQVNITDDMLSEEAETFRVVLQTTPGMTTPGVTLGSTSTTVVTIEASDPLQVSLTGPGMVEEGTNAMYTLSLSGGDSTKDVHVTLGVAGSSTATEDDVTLPERWTLSAGAGTGNFALPIRADNLIETETLVVELLSVEGGGGVTTLMAGQVSASVTDRSAPEIMGNLMPDFLVGIQAAVASYTATDPNGDLVSWSVEGTDAVHFQIQSVGGVLSFVTEPDYNRPSDADGDRVYELQVIAEDDGVPVARTTVNVRVTLRPGNLPDSAVTFDADAYTAAEGAEVTVMVSLNPSASRALEIPITLGGGTAGVADWSVAGLEGTAGSYTLMFMIGDVAKTFIITVLEDRFYEGTDNTNVDETLNLNFGSLPAAVVAGTHTTATLALQDTDPGPPTFQLSADPATLTEGSGPVDVMIRLNLTWGRKLKISG